MSTASHGIHSCVSLRNRLLDCVFAADLICGNGMKVPALWVIVVSLATSQHCVFGQGALAPPGPPAASMKSLDQVEPRTPIESLPFSITQGGSYYLAKNLQFSATSGDAITIAASDVTLDLMGFTLSSSSAVTGSAIRINASLRNVAVRNGVITGTTTVKLSGPTGNRTVTVTPGGFASGIRSSDPEATECHFVNLRISGCRSVGLNAGDNALVQNVTARENGATGIGVGPASTVTASIASFNGTFGLLGSLCVVTNVTADSNGATGVDFGSSTINSAVVRGNGGDGINASDGVVTNCRASANDDDGIAASGGTVLSSHARFNGENGINVSEGVVAYCKSLSNNAKNNGSTDIRAPSSTRTGNNPTP
jgi:hypothetical protein